MAKKSKSGWSRVYDVVVQIPEGKVATYGMVAALAGMPRGARAVGFALNKVQPDQGIPWHRVINARGTVSPRGNPEFERLQRAMLEQEGVVFDEEGRTDLKTYLWRPPGWTD